MFIASLDFQSVMMYMSVSFIRFCSFQILNSKLGCQFSLFSSNFFVKNYFKSNAAAIKSRCIKYTPTPKKI